MTATLQHPKTTLRIEPAIYNSNYKAWSLKLAQTNPTESAFLEAFADIRRLLPRDGMEANPEAVKEIKTIMWERAFEQKCTREGDFLTAIDN